MADENEQTGKSIDPAEGPSRASRLYLVLGVLIVTLVLDLWSKAWAWEHLREGAKVTVIENWVEWEFGFNTGSAFSLLRDASWARVTFIGVTVIAVLYMARLAMTLPTRWASSFIAVALVSGGALGNLHDRLFRIMEVRGEERYGVVDFIKVHYWPGKVWPTFNIADVALVVGVGLLLIFLTRHGDALEGKEAEDATDDANVDADDDSDDDDEEDDAETARSDANEVDDEAVDDALDEALAHVPDDEIGEDVDEDAETANTGGRKPAEV